MKFNKPVIIPAALLVYLAAMAYIGYPAYASGETSPLNYFGVVGVTLLIIILLHFSLKRRERLRRERLDDIERQQNRNKE